MKNTTGQAIIRACGALALGAAALAPMAADAALQQGTAPTVGGGTAQAVLDTASGLQWLTPRATMGLSYTQVIAADYASLGYRHASSGELLGLLGHAGFDLARLVPNLQWPYTSLAPSDMAAMAELVALLGATHVPMLPTGSNPYGDQYVYGILSDVDPVVANPDMGHRLSTLAIAGWGAYVVMPGRAFPTADGNAGSFLVRTVTAVPESGTLGMLAAGLLVVAAGVRRARAVHE